MPDLFTVKTKKTIPSNEAFRYYFFETYFKNTFDFKGRMSRRRYWLGVLSCAAFSLIIACLYFMLVSDLRAGAARNSITALYFLLYLWLTIGGIAAVSLVFLISSLVGRYDSSGSLILAGIAVNALFNAFISALSSLIPDVLSSYSAFSIGGFSSIQSSQLYVPGAVIIITASACFFIAEQMNILKLGDEIASSMGYCPRYIRIVLVSLSALLASSAVTFSGLLGFVGLVTPHLASLLSGGESRKTMVMTIISGPLLVLLADLLSRTIIMPSELPAGVFMAIIGVPFFIFLLIRRARRW